jgi:Xaa-Pro dipeptidase
MFDLTKTQAAIRQFGFDGWLLYDFRGSNILARRILGISDQAHTSRRFLYWVPAQGEPRKIVHRIEDSTLDFLPGQKVVYLRWQDFQGSIRDAVSGSKRVAMEYSAKNLNPYVSKVDAGTVELVRSFGPEVASSGDLVQLFEAVWDDEQERSHFEAATHTNAAYDIAWSFIASQIRSTGSVAEKAVQQVIMDHFQKNGMTTYSPPIVARNAHAGMPHYETGTGRDTVIREGDLVLIDLWAKMDRPRAVYSDLTRMGFAGTEIPERYAKLFRVVTDARDAAIQYVTDAFAAGRPVQGWEIDDACRNVTVQAGYGQHFAHRTGHSIGQEVHGNGANIDNLETHEERLILPRTCVSVEPGLYFDDCGFRSEIDVYVDAAKRVHVTGGALQTAIVPILK